MCPSQSQSLCRTPPFAPGGRGAAAQGVVSARYRSRLAAPKDGPVGDVRAARVEAAAMKSRRQRAAPSLGIDVQDA
jgi:hypothetical protein